MEVSRQEVRKLYGQACHGAGADARSAAREQLESIVAQSGQRLGSFFEEFCLDIGAYFASRPIT